MLCLSAGSVQLHLFQICRRGVYGCCLPWLRFKAVCHQSWPQCLNFEISSSWEPSQARQCALLDDVSGSGIHVNPSPVSGFQRGPLAGPVWSLVGPCGALGWCRDGVSDSSGTSTTYSLGLHCTLAAVVATGIVS